MTSKLETAIRRLVPLETLRDISNHGADCGVPEFTYLRETTRFYRQHQADIVAMVEALADELGESPTQLVHGFRCLNGNYSEAEIGLTLYYGPPSHDEYIANALAWFALEEVANQVMSARGE